jgi:hypothetical protein
MAPGAALPDTTGGMTARDTPVGTDGHLVDSAYQAPLQGMVGTAAVPGRDNMTSVGTSLSSSDIGSARPSSMPAVGTPGDADVVADVHHVESDRQSQGGAKGKAQGFLGKIKQVIS